jgi:hypothetical protein
LIDSTLRDPGKRLATVIDPAKTGQAKKNGTHAVPFFSCTRRNRIRHGCDRNKSKPVRTRIKTVAILLQVDLAARQIDRIRSATKIKKVVTAIGVVFNGVISSGVCP